MNKYQNKIYDLLKKVRLNALTLVDSFGWSDSNLSSSLGVYDGNVYERLFQFAKNSPFNEKEVNDSFYKLLKPYTQRRLAKL